MANCDVFSSDYAIAGKFRRDVPLAVPPNQPLHLRHVLPKTAGYSPQKDGDGKSIPTPLKKRVRKYDEISPLKPTGVIWTDNLVLMHLIPHRIELMQLSVSQIMRIQVPCAYPRALKREHVVRLKCSLMEHGLVDDRGFVTICSNAGYKTKEEDFQLEVLRGRHLLEAFKECVREGKIIDKADEEDIPCGNENVRFVERLQCSIFVPANDREDTRITESEKLAIASHYNSIDSVSCEMTFMDNMSLSLQYVRSKLESYGRRAHMDDSMREGASNMTIWSDLKKITDAAVQVCLIGYSKTSHFGDDADELPETRGARVRRRQHSFMKAALGFYAAPLAYEIAMGMVRRNNVAICSRLWSLEMFGLDCFAHANDNTKSIFMLLLRRRDLERRALQLTHVRRGDINKFFTFVGTVLREIVAGVGSNYNKFKANILDILPSKMRNHADLSIRAQGSTVADSAVFYAVHWEEGGAWDTETVLRSVREDVKGWPFSRQWRSSKPARLDPGWFECSLMHRTGRSCSSLKVALTHPSDAVPMNNTTLHASARVPVAPVSKQKRSATESIEPDPTALQVATNPAILQAEQVIESKIVPFIRRSERKKCQKFFPTFPEACLSKPPPRRRKKGRAAAHFQSERSRLKSSKLSLLTPNPERFIMYDSISVPLPDATDVRTLPSVCHEEGAWNRFISELDICRIRNELQQNCSQSFCDAFNVPTPDCGSDNHQSVKYGEHMIDLAYNAYCSAHSQELRETGYTVLPQVLLNTTAGEDLRSVLTTFGNRWEGEKPPEQKSDDDPWRQIFNSGTKVDKSDAASGAGRYTIPVAEQVNDLILNNPDLFAQRERAEAAIGVLFESIVQTGSGEAPLQFPTTGSRLLFHTPNARKQKAHCDFETVSYEENAEAWNPPSEDLGYFAMAAGEDGFHLRVWEQGHKLLFGPPEAVEHIAPTISSRVLFVPPFSVLLVRGDLPHAGVGGEENAGDEWKMRIRLHIYIHRKGRPVLDQLFFPAYPLNVDDLVNLSDYEAGV